MPLIATSISDSRMLGSVNNRNFVPVSVWKQVSVKKLEERWRIPVVGVVGSGGVRFEVEEEGNLGVRERVMAWTPWKVPARMSMSFAVRCWRGEVWGWVWFDDVVVVWLVELLLVVVEGAF